jgi:hypothetical protein
LRRGIQGLLRPLVDPEYTDRCVGFVTEKYLAQFPNLNGAYSTHVCHTSDGVGVFLK